MYTHISEHEQWAANAAAPGEQLGVRCLAQGSHLSRGIERGERAGYSLPPPTKMNNKIHFCTTEVAQKNIKVVFRYIYRLFNEAQRWHESI